MLPARYSQIWKKRPETGTIPQNRDIMIRNSILTLGGLLLSIGLGACSGSPVAPAPTLTPTVSGLVAGASTSNVVSAPSGRVRVLDAGETGGDTENVEPAEPKEPAELKEPVEPKEPAEPKEADDEQNQGGNNGTSGQNTSIGTHSIKVIKH